MITADTITDEQIRQLRDSTTDPMLRALCDSAIWAGKRFGRRNRALCAEILNARVGGHA